MNLQNRVDKLERQAGGERLTVSRKPFSKVSLSEMTHPHRERAYFDVRYVRTSFQFIAPVFRFAVALRKSRNAL